MTVMQTLLRGSPMGVESTDTPEGLSAIHKPGCAAAIWHRQILPEFSDWINTLDPAQLPQGRLVIRPDRVRDAVQTLCDVAGTPDDPFRRFLIDDAAALADLFSSVMQAPYVRMRFDIVTTNACRKFHVDAVMARLVCTYRGSGTQYGTAHAAADPDEIHAAPEGSAVMLRGTLWPEEPDARLRHRSPPIEGSGETRLLYVLDPIYDIEDEA